MATKVEWNALDYAAKDILSELVFESGYSYREIENLLQGELTYSRVRDICVARRTPVRLSEFVMLSTVCHSTPAVALQKVFDRLKGMDQAEYDAMSDEDKQVVDQLSDEVEQEKIAKTLQLLHDDPMVLVAYRNGHKQENIDGEAGPDYDEPA